MCVYTYVCVGVFVSIHLCVCVFVCVCLCVYTQYLYWKALLDKYMSKTITKTQTIISDVMHQCSLTFPVLKLWVRSRSRLLRSPGLKESVELDGVAFSGLFFSFSATCSRSEAFKAWNNMTIHNDYPVLNLICEKSNIKKYLCRTFYLTVLILTDFFSVK